MKDLSENTLISDKGQLLNYSFNLFVCLLSNYLKLSKLKIGKIKISAHSLKLETDNYAKNYRWITNVINVKTCILDKLKMKSISYLNVLSKFFNKTIL